MEFWLLLGIAFGVIFVAFFTLFLICSYLSKRKICPNCGKPGYGKSKITRLVSHTPEKEVYESTAKCRCGNTIVWYRIKTYGPNHVTHETISVSLPED